ncbi:MAG: hypothetical protein AAFQ92_17235, partial [Bacteroidota bacterium]
MNPYTRTFHLQQHTPIIHFQYQDEGATLRATELKPKLDQFIYQYADNIPSGWKVGRGKGEHPALNYKVRIRLTGKYLYEVIKQGDKNLPTFFGNMGDKYNYNKKALVETDKPLVVEFTSIQTDLLDEVEKHFPAFIAQTNFGTRQNKGFGSFGLWSEKTQSVIDPGEDLNGAMHLSPTRVRDFHDILTIINYYHQRLKSGINYRDHYHKSFLFT